MATIITISKEDSAETIQQKIKQLPQQPASHLKRFDAKKYTGKIKSYGDGIAYQRKLRNEWG